MKPTATRLIVILLLFSILLTCLPACSKRQKKFEASWFEYFDTFSTLTAYAESQEQFDEYANLCQSMLEKYHQLLDIYHDYEGIVNLKTINNSSSPKSIAIDPKLGEFLSFGKEMHRLTDGYTNIAMGSVLSLWHNARKNQTLPENEALIEANDHVNIDDLVLSEDKASVQKNDARLQIDAGALGKGFVAQKIAETLKFSGCHTFLLNLGGNTVSGGIKPDGTPWLVGIENPTNNETPNLSVKLSNASLVTSGSYQRYFTVNERNYHHIIHKDTLHPESYCLSVSVLHRDSGIADALSTALFCMTVEDGKKLLQEIDDAEALWLFPDGSIKTTDGFMNHVQTEK